VTASLSLKHRFGSAVMWNAVGTIALQGGTFATNLAVANLLGATAYGRFGFVIGTAQTLASVLQLCASMAASKYLQQYRKTEPGVAAGILRFLNRLSLAMGLLGTLVLLLFALTAADSFGPFSGLGTALAIAAPVVICTVLNGLQMGALAGLEGFAKSARAMLPLMILQVVSTSLAAAQFGLVGALAAVTLNLVLRAWVCARLVAREMHVQGLVPVTVDRGLLRRMLTEFMLPGALAGLANLPALWLATAALTRLPDGYAEVGRFNAALALRGVLMMVPWVINGVSFSLLNAHLGPGHERDYRRILGLSLLGCGLAAGIGALFVLATSPWLLRAYGHGFAAAEPVLHVLMLSLVAEALAWPLYQALASRRRVWVAVLTSQLPRDLAIAGLGVYLAGRQGALGVAWAHVCGWCIALLGCAALLAATPRTAASS
jgi:O-antigen/teichoic acid export membrane protein